MIKLSEKDLLKMAVNAGHNVQIKKKTRNAFDRLNDATDIMNELGVNDKIYFNADSSICIIEFRNIAFLSNNDLLRIDNRDIYKFKMAWHERVHSLVQKVDLTAWSETKQSPLLIEFMYKTKNAQEYDPDAIVSAFKSVLDGLVNSGILVDDKVVNVPLIIPRQEKTKKENSLFIVLSKIGNVERFYSDTFNNVIKNFSNA
jgi:hypothetical protein